MRRAVKVAVMQAYCRGWVSFRTAHRVFRALDLGAC